MKNPELGIIALAVPVNCAGHAMSLGLTMPLSRCSAAVRSKIIVQLKNHAERLARTSPGAGSALPDA